MSGAAATRAWGWGRLGALLAGASLVVSAPWWGRRAAQEMAFFRLQRVEIEGARFLRPADVMSRLRVDTLVSVWDDLGPLEARVADHPQVASVRISRRLPGTLVVRVVENLPVALVPAAGGFRALDARGRILPVDPAAAGLDLPIVATRDTALLRLLADVRRREPSLFGRISDVRRVGKEEVRVRLSTVPVRASADLDAGRLADIIPVERDLARRGARVAELDLRYRDQVIARLQ
jgi:cell division protein FtsQ